MGRELPRVALFGATFEGGAGGIARIARIVAKVLAGWVRAGRIEARAWSLLDAHAPPDIELPLTVCGGSRLRFVAHCSRAALTHTHFLYDQLGLSRAHLRLPLRRRPYLSYVHGIEIWEEARRDRLVSVRRADALVTHAHHTTARANALYGGFERVRVCWPATENDQAPQPRPPRGPPRVLTVSRIDDVYKGHDLLVDCWPAVTAVVPEARLTFVGHGTLLDQLRRRAAASPCGDRIEVCGFVPEGELDEFYAGATVFALPSRGEGFGLVYAEAMRHALPVVATVHDAGQEVNVDAVTGYNVNLDRPEELPRRLIELLSDPEKARTMGERGFERWTEHFRYSAFEARFSALLDEFLRHGRLDG
ncbi:MAG: glycosyltransferase family 4 protein [bacterium]|nr:glycosyltransferase family 4 protein [bacterium]